MSISIVNIIEFILLYCSGALIWLFFGHKDKRRPFSEFAFLSAASSIALIIALGVPLSIFKIFSTLNLLIGIYGSIIIICIIILYKKTPRGFSFKSKIKESISTPLRPGCKWHYLIVLLLVIMAAYLYFKPAEYLIGGFDPGIYVNTGINLSKNGTTLFDEPIVKELGYEKSRRFLGIFMINPLGISILSQFDGNMASQFYPGLIIHYATSYDCLGINLFLFIQPLIALISLFALYLLGSKIFGKKVSAAATVLYGFHIITVWFARYPIAEPLTVLLAAAGIYLIFDFYEKSELRSSIIAGILISAALLTRPDAVLLLIPLGFLFFYRKLTGRNQKHEKWSLIISIMGLLLSLFYAATETGGYLHGVLISFLGIGLHKEQSIIKAAVILGGIPVLLMLAIYIYKKREVIRHFIQRYNSIFKFTPTIISALLLSLIIFQFFVRPTLPFAFLSPNDNSLIRLGWYFAPLGLGWDFVNNLPFPWSWLLLKGSILFASIAAVYTLEKSRDYKKRLFFGIWLLYALIYFQNLRIEPIHFWLNRRYLSFILFGLLIYLSYMLTEFWNKKWKYQLITRIGVILIFLFYSINFAFSLKLIADNDEMKGMSKGIARLHKQLPAKSIILIDDLPPYSLTSLHLPLKTIYDRRVSTIKKNTRYLNSLPTVIEFLEERYDSVFLLSSDNNIEQRVPGYWEFVETGTISVPVFEKTTVLDYRPPEKVEKYNILFNIYQNISTKTLKKLNGSIDIGKTGDSNFIRGDWYGAEQEGETDYRWTGEQVIVLLPSSIIGNKIVLRLASGRPMNRPSPAIDIKAGGIPVAEIVPDPLFTEYQLKIPQEAKVNWGVVKMEIRSRTWKPQEYGSPDPRKLGVKIDSIKWTD